MLLMDGVSEFCQNTSNIWAILGYVVLVMKIVIPLLLIIFGMVDLGKAVVSSDEKAISKSVGTLIKRFIAAVIVFFIPAIVSALFNVLGILNSGDYNVCVQCVTNVNDDVCNNARTAANNNGYGV